MALIDYNTFVAQVQKTHLDLLATFTAATRVRVQESDTQQIDAIRQQCLELFNVELLERVAEGYERVNGETWRTFDGYVVNVAHGYVQRLASERIALSRDPLPTEPAPAPAAPPA